MKRVEGVRDGIETTRFLMRYNYRRREEAPYSGVKVFMDAHEPVTLEEVDRYPLTLPKIRPCSSVGRSNGLLIRVSVVRAHLGEPKFGTVP